MKEEYEKMYEFTLNQVEREQIRGIAESVFNDDITRDNLFTSIQAVIPRDTGHDMMKQSYLHALLLDKISARKYD